MLRHPLQPFAPAAFGDDDGDGHPDPRVFSYRGHWHPAAGRVSGAREALPPWMPANASLPVRAREDALSLDALRRFLLDPADSFLRQRLDLRLPGIEAGGDDIEPLLAPARGLERNLLQRAVFDALLAGDAPQALQSRLRARGQLPSGAPGKRVLEAMLQEVAPYAEAFARWRGDAGADARLLEVDIDGLRLHGRIADVYPHGIARVRIGAPNGPSVIRNGLDWLLAAAAGIDAPFEEFRPARRTRAWARIRATFRACRHRCLARPAGAAPRRPATAAAVAPRRLELFRADTRRVVSEAAKRWRGSERSWAEGDGDALRLALRARDPFASAEALREVAHVAVIVFGTLAQGTVARIDIENVEPPDADDAEDAA